MSTTTKATEALTERFTNRGYLFTGGAYANGVEFIKVSRPASPNRNFGELTLTPHGWNFAFLDALPNSMIREMRTVISEDVAARQSTEQMMDTADRRDNI